MLENWFLETPEATIVAFEYPETRAQKLLRSRVETFLAECATVNFIKTCNFTNGYAPSASEVASQFVETLRGREELTTHQGLEHASRWQRRCFRGRWGLRLRSLEPHRDSETDLRAKARLERLQPLLRNVLCENILRCLLVCQLLGLFRAWLVLIV